MYESLFDSLNNEAHNSRVELLRYLTQAASDLRTSTDTTQQTAYNIAGLMATDFARSLPDDDPIEEIFTIAGELELMPQNHEQLRDELITKIAALK